MNALARTDCTVEPGRCLIIKEVADRNRDDIISSIAESRPGMIVFDKNPGYFDRPFFDWQNWLVVNPAYAPLMAGYRKVTEDDRFSYWVRTAS